MQHALSLSRAFGMLKEDEVELLHELAMGLPEGAVIINIGAGFGTSSLAMIEDRQDLAESTYTIDFSKSSPLGGMENERNAFTPHGLKYPVQILANSTAPAEHWDKGKADLIFIDAGHSKEDITKDIEAWLPHAKKGCFMVFHDYGSDLYPDVKPVVDEKMGKYEIVGKAVTMIAYRVY